MVLVVFTLIFWHNTKMRRLSRVFCDLGTLKFKWRRRTVRSSAVAAIVPFDVPRGSGKKNVNYNYTEEAKS